MQGLGPEGARMWRLAGTYSALGLEMALAVGIGAVAGHYLDEYMQWAPYGVLFGFMVGLGAAILGIMRAMAMARTALKRPTPQDPRHSSGP
jgi:F0F1-type ATP synthase assembly protein I